MKALLRHALTVLTVTFLSARAVVGQEMTAQNLPLQPGDRLLVRTWADTSRADSLIVQADGSVMLPRLGPVNLTGVSAGAIGDSVRSAYALLLNPVSVEVTPLRRVSIVGSVYKPDVLYLETRATVRDAVARAGGVNDVGRVNPVTLIRGNQQLDLSDWRTRGDSLVIVHSGDVIVVNRESWFKRNVFSIISGMGLIVSLIIASTR